MATTFIAGSLYVIGYHGFRCLDDGVASGTGNAVLVDDLTGAGLVLPSPSNGTVLPVTVDGAPPANLSAGKYAYTIAPGMTSPTPKTVLIIVNFTDGANKFALVQDISASEGGGGAPFEGDFPGAFLPVGQLLPVAP